MEKIHIFNPKAGKKSKPPQITDGDVYFTKCVGDAQRFVYEVCRTRDVHFIVHGGDGTISEVANGIIKANAGERALFSVVPKGTGNDFVRSFDANKDIRYIDAISFNNNYCINSLNTGLDLRVVEGSNKFKKLPFVSGSVAYFLGVLDAVFRKSDEKWHISLVNSDGSTEEFSNESFSLALFANGRFYGGGFNAAPLADTNDGIIDVILVKKISLFTLAWLILSYRAGKHFSDGGISDKFKRYVIYRHCTGIKISNITKICSDGEIYNTDCAEINIVPNALRYI